MSGPEQLRRALARKRGEAAEDRPILPGRAAVPDPIVFATAGTRVAQDGKTYTIIYEEAT